MAPTGSLHSEPLRRIRESSGPTRQGPPVRAYPSGPTRQGLRVRAQSSIVLHGEEVVSDPRIAKHSRLKPSAVSLNHHSPPRRSARPHRLRAYARPAKHAQATSHFAYRNKTPAATPDRTKAKNKPTADVAPCAAA